MKSKSLLIVPAIIMMAGIFVLSGCNLPQTGTNEPATVAPSPGGESLGSVYRYASGSIQVSYHYAYTETKASWNTVTAYVDPDEVLIGGYGGVNFKDYTINLWSDYVGYLTGTFPVSDSTGHMTGWRTQSKDHNVAFPHTTYSVAIGLKIKDSKGNYASRQLLEYNIQYVGYQSGYANHPSATAKVNSGYKLIGGGAQVLSPFGEDGVNKYGNLLTDNKMTDKLDGWYAASKDQIYASPARIVAWAVCIRKKLEYLGSGFPSSIDVKISKWITKSTSGTLGWMENGGELWSGYLLAGGGVSTKYNGYGRLLVAMEFIPSFFNYYRMGDHICGQPDSTLLGVRSIYIK
jgi:hypothetical protein